MPVALGARLLGETPRVWEGFLEEVTLYLNPKTSGISQRVMWRYKEFQKRVQPERLDDIRLFLRRAGWQGHSMPRLV